MMKMNKKGFTIVELVIVIAVIAILAAVMIPTFSGIVTKANISALEQKVSAGYKEAMAADLADNGLYDNSFDGDNVAKVTGGEAKYYLSNNMYYTFETNGNCTVSWTTAEHGKTGATIINGVLTLTPVN